MAQRTINSPGVEIRESDLSLTAPLNVGTNVYATGFAQQGPLDEVLKITTKQELNQIFGVPTNSPERYLYYTLTELLNSPANVYASRLPYGHGSGDGFGSKYSALVYPVRNVTGDAELGQLSAYQLNFNFAGTATRTQVPTDYVNALSGVEIGIQSGSGILSSIVFGVSAKGASWIHKGTVYYSGSSTNINSGGTTNVITLCTARAGGNTLQTILTTISGAINTAKGSGETINFTQSGIGLSLRIGLSGSVPAQTYGTISDSVVEPWTDTSDTFSISAYSNQQISTDLDTVSAVYVLGEPTHLELTEAQYLSGLNGTAFTWSKTAGLKNSFSAITDAGAAGAVILNKSTSTVNNQFEGYYVGLADNTNTTPGSNFNNILTTKTITASAASTTSFTIIPPGTQVFKLSSNYQTGPDGTISQVIENFTEYEIDGRDDDDILSLGVFKLRKSIYANEAFKLDYVLADGIAGSINYYRTKLNPNGGADQPFFVESRDDSSRNVVVKVNDYVSNRLRGTNALDANGDVNKRVRVYTTQLATETTAAGVARTGIAAGLYTSIDSVLGKAESLYPLGAYTESSPIGKELGDIPNKLERALDGIRNDEIYDIDVVVEGGLGTIYAIASADNKTYYDEYATTDNITAAVNGLRTSNDVTGTALTLRNNYSTIFNKFEQFVSPPYLGGSRGDCIFIADPLDLCTRF